MTSPQNPYVEALIKDLRRWLYLETGSSNRYEVTGRGPDPVGQGSLQEEEIRTQTGKETTT